MLSPSLGSSHVYTVPDPWPTGPLKMKKVHGDGMFNAWSHLLLLRLPPLSQDAASTNKLYSDRSEHHVAESRGKGWRTEGFEAE